MDETFISHHIRANPEMNYVERKIVVARCYGVRREVTPDLVKCVDSEFDKMIALGIALLITGIVGKILISGLIDR